MLTLFTIPKAFRGHIAVIQENAIRSWLALGPDVRVVLMGDDAGVADAAARLGTTHLPQVARNRYGTPLLNDLFHQAQQIGDSRVCCYINADILMMDDFLAAVGTVARQRRRFLLVGQRTDVDLTQPLDFGGDWRTAVRGLARESGKLRQPPWIDYFVFSRGLWGALPPFAIGRTAWDNWLIYRARSLRVPVIDATAAVLAVHQNHDYNHTGKGYKGIWNGPEARRNFALAGGKSHLFTIWDSTHVLDAQGVRRRQGTGLGGGIWSYRRSGGLAG